jgi:hypothetical protein
MRGVTEPATRSQAVADDAEHRQEWQPIDCLLSGDALDDVDVAGPVGRLEAFVEALPE